MISNPLLKIISWFIPSKLIRRKIRLKYFSSNKLIVINSKGKECNKKIKGLKVIFCGENSTVKIHQPCKYKNCTLTLGTNNEIEIKPTQIEINNLKMLYPMREGSKLYIEENLSCVGMDIYMHDEPNTTVKIGKDCQISFGVIIWPSDGHAITDLDGNCLNKGKDITIGNHVWIGMDSKILKGANIPDNSVLAAGSIYTQNSNPKSPIQVGGGYLQVFLQNLLSKILCGTEKIAMILKMKRISI